MEYMSNKVLLIAVSLFVTIGISSAVLYTITQVKTVYQKVYETDTSIQSSFDEYEPYENSTKSALDLLNTAKKYRDSDDVYIVETSGDIENYIGNRLSDNVKLSNAIANKINSSLEIENLNNRLGENGGRNGINYIREYNTYVDRLSSDKVIIVFATK